MDINKIIEKKVLNNILSKNKTSDAKTKKELLENDFKDFFGKNIKIIGSYKSEETISENVNQTLRPDSEYLGFTTYKSRMSKHSNPSALKANDPSTKNPSSFLKIALDKAGIAEKDRVMYFIDVGHYDTYTKTGRLGKTGYELGISGKGDPYTYAKVGKNKYKVISGPIDTRIGKTFAFTKNNEKIKGSKEYSQKQKQQQKQSINKTPEEVRQDNKAPIDKFFDNTVDGHSFALGNTAGGVGQKFIQRDENGKIVATYLFPFNRRASGIMRREPGQKFKEIVITSGLLDIIDKYEEATGERIKIDRVDENDPNAREVTENDIEVSRTKAPTSHLLDLKFYKDVLAGIGAPATKENLKFMSAWGASENTVAQFNPLATTLPYHSKTWENDPGMTVFNTLSGGPGVKNYSTYEAGVAATVRTMYSGKGEYYKMIREKLIAGTYLAVEIAKHTDELKKWVGYSVSSYCWDLLTTGGEGPIDARRGRISTKIVKQVKYGAASEAEKTGPINAKNYMARKKETIPECPNFKWSEFVKTSTGIDNTPESDAVIRNIEYTAKLCQDIRDKLGSPLAINSGYRNEEVNNAVGGATDSYHRKGLAADIQTPKYNSSKEFAKWIAQNRKDFPTLKKILWYKGKPHVHIVVTDGGMQRTGNVDVNQYDGDNDGLNKLIDENTLRSVIRSTILKEGVTDDIKYIQKYIGVPKPTGNWKRDKTDTYFQKFVKDNVEELLYLTKGDVTNPQVLIRNSKKPVFVASIVMNTRTNPQKTPGYFASEQAKIIKRMLMLYDENFGGETKEQRRQRYIRASKFSTNDKFVYKGGQKNIAGMYPPGFGIKNKYYKILFNDITIALEDKTADLYYRFRGSKSGFKPLSGVLEKTGALNEQDEKSKIKVKPKTLTRNFIGQLYNKLGKETLITDPDFVYKTNKTKIGSLIAIGKEKLQNIKTSRAKKNVEINDHPFVDLASMGIKLVQIEDSKPADVAKKLLNKFGNKNYEATQADREEIVKNVHMIAKKNLTGTDMKQSIVNMYTNYLNRKVDPDNGYSMAWSAWFINRIHEPGCEAFNQIKLNAKNNTNYEGCCYPWYMALKNRKNIIKNPEAYIGKTLLVMFTKEEVKANLSLDQNKIGTLSLVGQGGPNPQWSAVKQKTKLTGGYHMNIKTSSGWIGGNLSGKVSVSSKNDKNAHVFVMLVKIGKRKPGKSEASFMFK